MIARHAPQFGQEIRVAEARCSDPRRGAYDGFGLQNRRRSFKQAKKADGPGLDFEPFLVAGHQPIEANDILGADEHGKDQEIDVRV